MWFVINFDQVLNDKIAKLQNLILISQKWQSHRKDFISNSKKLMLYKLYFAFVLYCLLKRCLKVVSNFYLILIFLQDYELWIKFIWRFVNVLGNIWKKKRLITLKQVKKCQSHKNLVKFLQVAVIFQRNPTFWRDLWISCFGNLNKLYSKMFRSTASFDRMLERATSNLLLEPDWNAILQICDSIRSGDTNPKYAVTSIKKKIYHDNPHVVLYALTVSTTYFLI